MTLWHWLRPYISLFVRFMRISFLEAKSEYYGTRLGLLWLPTSTLIFTAMLALVFRHSDSMPIQEFFLYVLSGYVLWLFIQDSINGSTDVIQKRLEFAIHNNLSLAGLFGKLLVDRLFMFSLNLILLVAAVVVLAPQLIGLNLFAFIPFLIIVTATSLAVAYIVNLTTVAFPDLATLIRTGTRFVFFASPIFWTPADDGMGIRQVLVTYNPVSYFLGMIRQCFGLEAFSALTWGISLSMGGLLCLVGWIAFSRSESMIRNIK